MVSWWHSFNIRWKRVLKEYGFVAVDMMKSAQTNFGLIDAKDREFEKDLQTWFKGTGDIKRNAGVLLLAVKGSNEGEGGSISILHHVIVLKESVSPDIVGLDSFDANMAFKGVKSADLFGRLTPHKGARKAGASDFFIPSLDGLTDGTHPTTGKFVPGAKDVCANIQSLESKNNGVFVPHPLAQLLLGEEIDIEDSEEEGTVEEEPSRFNPRNPMDLLNRLVRVMSYKKTHQPEWYRDWKSIAQEVVGLLWSVGNGFATGIEVFTVGMDRQLIEHQMECALELFKSDRELYGEDEEEKEVEYPPSDREIAEDDRRGNDISSPTEAGPRKDSEGKDPSQDISIRSSPFSRGSSFHHTPSPRKDRQGISFEMDPLPAPARPAAPGDFSNDHYERGESKEADTNEPARERGYQDSRRSAREEVFPEVRIPGAPDWAEKLASQFLSGFLSSAQALSTVGASLSDFAEASKSSLEKKEERKKAISKWLPSGVFLFKALSSEDGWNTRGIPELTDFASKLIDQKIFGATQLIRSQKKSLKWPGGLLKPGVGEFLKRGFVSEDVQVGPSGFSVLFFHPSCHADTDSEEFSIQQLNESFGDGKLPEEMMKTFSKLQIWVPQTVQDAEEQVDTAIRFLKSICGDSTIAIGGYATGLNLLAENRRLFRARGTMFLLNFMYMLDRVFQAFCQELLKYEEEEDPIQVARSSGAQGWMEKLIEVPVQTWLVAGTVPLYSSPSAWDDKKFGEGLVDLHGAKSKVSGGAGGGAGGAQSPAAKKRKIEKAGDDGKEKAWHRSLESDEYIKEWFLPEGEERNFFNYFSPSKPENFYGFPKVAHHKTGRPAHICIRYIIGNGPGCSRGSSCLRSHIRMADLSAEEKNVITKQLKKVKLLNIESEVEMNMPISRVGGWSSSGPRNPPQGNSPRELGGLGPPTLTSEYLNSEVAEQRANAQIMYDREGQPKVLHTGHGDRETRPTDSIGPTPNRLSQGKRKREEVGSSPGRGDSHCRLDPPSFWDKTLPRNLTTFDHSDPLVGSGGNQHPRPSRVEEEAAASSSGQEVLESGWEKAQETVDLATSESDIRRESNSLAAKRKGDLSWIDDIPQDTVGDPALRRARRRNVIRLKRANEADLSIMSKYLPADSSLFFPFEVEGPDDDYHVKASWLGEVLETARLVSITPKAPLVKFGTSPSDLDSNTEYLKSCNWDFEEVFEQHKGTTVSHGSEFRPIEELRRFLGRHPWFEYLSEMLTSGFDYKLSRELSEEERSLEMSAQLTRGNHKSATDSESEVQLLLEGDVRHGFVLPVWESALVEVKGCSLQPGGMVRQLSLKSDGSRKIKNRFTHDLSFSITADDVSINSRVDMSRHPDMVYGWCFHRLVHYLAALRSKYPNDRIYLSKFDYSDAYKRISQSPKATAATVVRFGRIAYYCWRMVFGGSPNPAGFSCFSEMLTDLANEIAMSNYQPCMSRIDTVLPTHRIPKETEDHDLPIGQAIGPALKVSTTMTSYRDCFIDDIIDCHLGTPENLERAPYIVQLAVQSMSRPHAGADVEPVPRRPLLSPEKLEAEGRSAENQIVLGWEIKTRSFQISLPFDKHKAWKEDLDKLILTRQATQQETESMIGRLNHASFLIPLSRHFLNEIRAKCLSVPRRRGQHIRFTEEEVKDLMLWQDFLDSARRGISINLLVLRTPTRIAWSDSCPFGLGGYTLKGTAWRIKVPAECNFYGDDSVNNVLELLGMAISVLLLLEEAKAEKESFPCLLVMGDNTSAISWLFKSGKIPRSSKYYPIVKAIARRIALEVTNGHAQLCSQHIAGTLNVISDLLSFEGDCRRHVNPLTRDRPPNDVLTSRILSYHSQIVPSGFKIQMLPPEVESFAFSILQTIGASWNREENRPTRETTDIGEDGESSSRTGDWEETISSIRYPATTKDCYWLEDSSCLVDHSTSTDRAELLQSVRNQWYRRLFEMPLAAWHRRLGNVDGPAPSTSRSESMARDRSTQESSPF